jgi:hypothetical protein
VANLKETAHHKLFPLEGAVQLYPTHQLLRFIAYLPGKHILFYTPDNYRVIIQEESYLHPPCLAKNLMFSQ